MTPRPHRPSRRVTRSRSAVVGLALGALAAMPPALSLAQDPSPSPVEDRPVVAVAFYPIEEATRAVAGDRVEVIDLTPVGTSPHDLELTPAVADRLADVDLVLYLGAGFQPAVEDIVAALPETVARVDLLAGLELLQVDAQLPGTSGEVDGEVLAGGSDPHVWLDPIRYAEMTDTILDALTALDPAGAEAYAAGATDFTERIGVLHDRIAASLADCASRTIVTSHRAFGYFAARYGLDQLPIAGVSPAAEPDPRSMEAIAGAARERNVRTIFYESVVPRSFADTIAGEIGAAVDALEPVETLTDDQLAIGLDYLTLMDQNRAALVRGLPCFGE